MRENEVIIVNSIPDEEYDKIIINSVKYAIISLPFTIDRMELKNIYDRIRNIAKGKIAEGVFNFFCKANRINVDDSQCVTPFFKRDRRDFILSNYEWDIKNNFVKHPGQLFSGNYTELPALIPNRYKHDQWSKRDELFHDGLKGVRFLFSFMKKRTIYAIELSNKQQNFVRRLYKRFQGHPQDNMPFSIKDFWEIMKDKNEGKEFEVKIVDRPYLVITGYAGQKEFGLFREHDKYSSYLKGAFRTKINNQGTLIRNLPSFASLFPHLKNGLIFGEFRDKQPRYSRYSAAKR